MKIFLLLLFCSLSFSYQILFWNLRTFGIHRATDEVGQELAKITEPFDILLFAEIRSWESNEIMSFFEKYFPSYHLFITPSLHYCHSTSHSGSEEYGLFVKKTFPYSHQLISYSDPQCKFIRRPFGLQIQASNPFTLLVFHSMPGNQEELVLLDQVISSFGPSTFLMGDLNTGCEYTHLDVLNRFPIRSNYTWMLNDRKFTNYHLNCPYDRIIATNTMKNYLSFPRVLCNEKEADRIGSDHYPIAVQINI